MQLGRPCNELVINAHGVFVDRDAVSCNIDAVDSEARISDRSHARFVPSCFGCEAFDAPALNGLVMGASMSRGANGPA